jgi:hypothetical protein
MYIDCCLGAIPNGKYPLVGFTPHHSPNLIYSENPVQHLAIHLYGELARTKPGDTFSGFRPTYPFGTRKATRAPWVHGTETHTTQPLKSQQSMGARATLVCELPSHSIEMFEYPECQLNGVLLVVMV